MTNYARIVDKVAVDVSKTPAKNFHPLIAAEFTQVPDKVQHQWRLVAGEWLPPAAPLPVVPLEPIMVSTQKFKMLFSAGEFAAISEARKGDIEVQRFLDLIEDPQTTSVNLSLQSSQDWLLYLESLGLLTEARRVQILTGELQ